MSTDDKLPPICFVPCNGHVHGLIHCPSEQTYNDLELAHRAAVRGRLSHVAHVRKFEGRLDPSIVQLDSAIEINPLTQSEVVGEFSQWLDDEGFTCLKVDDPDLGGDAKVVGHLRAGHVEHWASVYRRFLLEQE